VNTFHRLHFYKIILTKSTYSLKRFSVDFDVQSGVHSVFVCVVMSMKYFTSTHKVAKRVYSLFTFLFPEMLIMAFGKSLYHLPKLCDYLDCQNVYKYFMLSICLIFFIYSSSNGDPAWFHDLAIVKSAVIEHNVLTFPKSTPQCGRYQAAMSGLWLLLHYQYWALTGTPLGYPVVILYHGDPAALDMQQGQLYCAGQVKYSINAPTLVTSE
ncbi:hypothetical protein STEG23_035863, partial [Scotinomys teguina]